MIAFFKAGKRDGRLKIGDPEWAATQFCGLIKEIVFWPEVGFEPHRCDFLPYRLEAAPALFDLIR